MLGDQEKEAVDQGQTSSAPKTPAIAVAAWKLAETGLIFTFLFWKKEDIL